VDNLTHVVDGTTFLGATLGLTTFQKSMLSANINSMLPPAKVLQRLPAQYGFQLLSRCINMRRKYACSVCEVEKFWEVLHEFDIAVDNSLADIAGLNCLSLEQAQISELPERYGGMGLHRFVHLVLDCDY
jgi:hypothetical protein